MTVHFVDGAVSGPPQTLQADRRYVMVLLRVFSFRYLILIKVTDLKLLRTYTRTLKITLFCNKCFTNIFKNNIVQSSHASAGMSTLPLKQFFRPP